jgi:uncharacterized protein
MYNIGISTSLDGTRQLHNINRKYADGRGSYDIVSEKIKLAQKAGVKVNVLTVVSKLNMNNVIEIFNELNEQDINHVGFLPCYLIKDNSLKYPSLYPSDYAKFMIDFFNLFLSRECCFKIREFEQLFSGIINDKQDMCSYTGHCGNFVCIDSSGDVYACDTGPIGSQYSFGNIVSDSLNNILSSEKWQSFIQDLGNFNADCLKCDYFHYCHNGCYNMRINGKYNYCEDRKMLYRYMLSMVRNLIHKGGDEYVDKSRSSVIT